MIGRRAAARELIALVSTAAWKQITLFSAPAGRTAAGKGAQTPSSRGRPVEAPPRRLAGPSPNDFLPLSPAPARRRRPGPAIFWPMIAIQAQTDISACTCLIFNQYLNHLYSRMGGCPGRAGRSALEKPRRSLHLPSHLLLRKQTLTVPRSPSHAPRRARTLLAPPALARRPGALCVCGRQGQAPDRGDPAHTPPL